jgi:hypothetical protein
MPNRAGWNADKWYVSPWQGTEFVCLRAAVAAAALFLCLAAVVPALARADESAWPTAQAKAYNFDWVPYLDPPAHPAAICLVDSGVDITPDTPADSPDGPILERTSLDGGPGTGIDSDHGTYMAMAAGAPMNGWGTVGLWPGLRIVSVRAMPQGQTTFPFDSYQNALRECELRSGRDHVTVVNLSLACSCAYTSAQAATLENRVTEAHARYGLNVVASAGNAGGSVEMPAAASGVVAVGASDLSGSKCAFSSQGPRLDLLAPGCDLDGAIARIGQPMIHWAGGTSAAAAIAASSLALLRSYRTDLTWDAAETVVKESATGTSDRPALNLERAFRTVGLDELVDAAKARATLAVQDSSQGTIESPAVDAGRAPKLAPTRDDAARTPRSTPPAVRAPRILHVSRSKHAVVLTVQGRRPNATVIAVLERRVGEFRYTRVRKVQGRRSSIHIPLPARWNGGRIGLRYNLGGQISDTTYHRVR